MAYPTAPTSFPTRNPGDVVLAAHLNAYGDELEAVEGAWLTGYGQTLAPFRVRNVNPGLEFGDGNASGGGSMLGYITAGSGVVGLHCEPGAGANTYKTRGIPGAILAVNAANTGFYVGAIGTAAADNQSPVLTMLLSPNGNVQLPFTPICRLRNSTTQAAIPINTMTALTFDTEDADVGGLHAPGSASVVIPAGCAGWYLLTARAKFVAQVNGYRGIYFHLNGTAIVGSQIQTTGSAISAVLSLIYLQNCAVGDTLDVRARHTAAVATGVGDTTRELQTEFTVMKVA
jgi:hypothetical protein